MVPAVFVSLLKESYFVLGNWVKQYYYVLSKNTPCSTFMYHAFAFANIQGHGAVVAVVALYPIF